MVRYARAVRYARSEEFDKAAQIYSDLSTIERADNAKEAARLYAATRSLAAKRSRCRPCMLTRIFWLQTPIAFSSTTACGGDSNLQYSRAERTMPSQTISGKLTRVQTLERKLKDEQEEYWRAYKILNGVVSKAGPTPWASRRLVARLCACEESTQIVSAALEEIHAADRRLSSWLERNEVSAKP
jgi:hypothetical protein